jgi:hypothetical protein
VGGGLYRLDESPAAPRRTCDGVCARGVCGVAGGDPDARAQALFDTVLGQGARLPSQRRFAACGKAEAGGVTLTAAEVERLQRLSAGRPG